LASAEKCKRYAKVFEIGKLLYVKIKEGGLDLFYFSFHFLFSFQIIPLFLEQLELGLIGHTITSVT